MEMSILGCCQHRFGVTASLMGINAHVCTGLGISLQSLGLPNPTHDLCPCVPCWQRQDQLLCLSGVILATAPSVR